jgi:hypothetical protein
MLGRRGDYKMSKHAPGVVCYIKGNTNYPKINGMFVTLVSKAFHGEFYHNITGKRIRFVPRDTDVIWRVKSNTPMDWGYNDMKIATLCYERPVLQTQLIPLEDKEGEDEMITIVGKPNLKEKEHERSSASCN